MPLDSFDLQEVRRIVQEGLRGHPARVYLFGSWARGEATRGSDIDVAILPLAPLPQGLMSEIREAIEESLVVYNVDLVDLSQAAPPFRDRVLHEGVLWTG